MTSELPHLLLQEDLCRGVQVEPTGACRIIPFSITPGWTDHLKEIDHDISGRILCLVSIEIARWIRRHCPRLARGLVLDEDRLTISHVTAWLPREMMLNTSWIGLPFGLVADRIEQIRMLFGERVFVRPDSAMKSFSGFCCEIKDLAFEISARRQIDHPDEDMMVVIDRARFLPLSEYRIWMMGEEIVTFAGYSHEARHRPGPCPSAILDLARRIAPRIEEISGPAVADFVLDETHTPKLIELNAISTSGLYAGADLTAIARAADRILL